MLSSGVDGDSHKWIDAENGGKIDELIRKTMSRISHCSPFYQGKMKFFATSESSRKAAGNKNRVFMMCHSCQSCKKTASFSEAMCSELPQQSYHQYNQSSIPSCDDRVFSDERPSVKMKLDDIWNNKLQAQGECTSTRDGESKEQQNWNRESEEVNFYPFHTLQMSESFWKNCVRRSCLKLVTNYYTTVLTKFKTGVGCTTFIHKLQDHLPGIITNKRHNVVGTLFGKGRDMTRRSSEKSHASEAIDFNAILLLEMLVITSSEFLLCVPYMCNRLARNDVQHLTPSVGTIDTEFDWRSILLFIEDTVMNLWTGSNSVDILVNYEIKKKKCRAQSCKVTLELTSPQPKKLIGECTVRREIRSSQNILLEKTRAVRRLQHSSKAICSELPQQSSHKCDQSSTQSCGDSVFSDERPSVKMKLVNMWNSKLHTQGVCTSTRYGESKEERYWNSLKNQNNILNVTSGILHFVGASLVPDIIDKTAWIGAPSFSLLTMVSYASFTPTTSKYSHSNDMHAFPASFGFKREALSSISDISLLDIVLKLTGGQMDINGKCLYLGVDDCRQNVRTTVIVRDVFYNQPVRRKQMHSNPKKVLHSLKESLLLYILSFKLLRLKVRMTCVAHMLLFLHVYYCPVSVAIGVGTCYVKVDDIGSGVTRWTGADGRKMCKLQGQGECTSTRDGESKEDDMHAFPASFGLKGETLSSISDVSLLELLPKLTGGQMDIDKVFFCREEALVSFELMKDKWRNMSVMTNGCGSREKARLALKRMNQTRKQDKRSLSLSSLRLKVMRKWLKQG
ncbi:hypothetical protein KY290_003239 [Solanum tuberosum]|uniref:CST complex subunit CTC1 n=1 Tax=Solanum tuberosum TaxID=4113 RepID=A0ABQ7WSD6_SOLTU|nr:hypothetical protein KY290_003239 [Solanum tuberosum]